MKCYLNVMTSNQNTPSPRFSARLQNKHLVIIDDDPDQLIILKAFFRHKVATLQTFTSGLEALAEVKGQPVDLIILDVMMPDCDGWEVYNRMRRDEHFKNVPVVFLSCLMNDEMVVHMDCPTRCAGLPKPVDMDLLMEKIEELLEID